MTEKLEHTNKGGDKVSTVAVPKKKQDMITEYIFDFIKQNHLVDGDKLPTERELSEMLQVSRTTTQKVFRDLELKGSYTSGRGVVFSWETRGDRTARWILSPT